MGVQIVYTSRTGNTEKLAEAVFAAVPVKEKNVKRIEERTERDDGEMYLVGFWTDRGTASSEILDLLGNLHGKKVALFGTCGMGNVPEYYDRILNGVAAFIPEDCEYLGGFLCQARCRSRFANAMRRCRTLPIHSRWRCCFTTLTRHFFIRTVRI